MSPRKGSPEVLRFLSGLGLAARARRLRIGPDAVISAIRSAEATVVVIAGDAPENVRRRLSRLAAAKRLPHVRVLDGDRLGEALGRERIVALALTDESLGKRVLELAAEVEG
ncbi:MAG: ribosomal L7Ae/L30e/S12e/Gadd45 family protein [Gemmatimonadota bacterium]|nr:MAG: ribosomal L7Ae/L30e/S12e/Gadd45 family protein [Gemmatimonadota bacterium]